MANFPFMTYQIPGVYGPTGVDILKTKTGYRIGWSGSWGKEPFFEGTIKEMARNILLKYGENLKQDLNIIEYYAAIIVQWKPEIVCTFKHDVKAAGFIGPEFLDELTKELKPLSKLLPFA